MKHMHISFYMNDKQRTFKRLPKKIVDHNIIHCKTVFTKGSTVHESVYACVPCSSILFHRILNMERVLSLKPYCFNIVDNPDDDMTSCVAF